MDIFIKDRLAEYAAITNQHFYRRHAEWEYDAERNVIDAQGDEPYGYGEYRWYISMPVDYLWHPDWEESARAEKAAGNQGKVSHAR